MTSRVNSLRMGFLRGNPSRTFLLSLLCLGLLGRQASAEMGSVKIGDKIADFALEGVDVGG